MQRNSITYYGFGVQMGRTFRRNEVTSALLICQPGVLCNHQSRIDCLGQDKGVQLYCIVCEHSFIICFFSFSNSDENLSVPGLSGEVSCSNLHLL